MIQQLVEPARLGKVLFEEARVLFLAHLWEQGRECRLHVSDETQIKRRPAAEMLWIRVNLNFFDVAVGQKFGKRKISPEQKQQIGAANRVVRSAVADETGHARGAGVVMLEPLLATEGVADGGFQFGGESQDFVSRVAAALAAEDGDGLCIVDQAGELFQVRLGRTKDSLGRNRGGMESVRRLGCRDVT